MWKLPTETPKKNTEVMFYLYTGGSHIGYFKKDKLVDSHKNEYSTYQIKKWCYVEDWFNDLRVRQNERQRG